MTLYQYARPIFIFIALQLRPVVSLTCFVKKESDIDPIYIDSAAP